MDGNESFKKLIRDLSNCPKCNSSEIVEGHSDSMRFDPGHKNWYKTTLEKGVEVQGGNAKCCAACGMAWMDLKSENLRKYIINKCEIKFAWEIYKPVDPQSLNLGDCLNCGSKGKIAGKLSGHDMTLKFWPTHFKRFANFSFNPDDMVVYESTSDCCTICGFITTRINTEKLNRFLLKYCKPEYLKQVYSIDGILNGNN